MFVVSLAREYGRIEPKKSGRGCNLAGESSERGFGGKAWPKRVGDVDRGEWINRDKI